MSHPQISIVTPVYNAAATVARTMESLRSQKASFEHLVYDGGSSDSTCEIVESYLGKYPVRLIRGDNLGVYGNVANAHKQSTGPIMGWINGDDFYLPWTLAVVNRVFETHPEVDWITGIPGWYWEDGGLAECLPYAPVYIREFIRRGLQRRTEVGYLQQESMFWRRRLYEKVGADAILRRYRYAADYHLWKAFAAETELRTVGSMLACFTFRKNQFSQVYRAPYDEECDIRSGTKNLSFLGGAFNRVASVVLKRRVIFPRDLVKGS
jgi:glycosyltransferase involved in cell wall biosynthesis